MKRFLALFLAALFLFTPLLSCNGNTPDATNVTTLPSDVSSTSQDAGVQAPTELVMKELDGKLNFKVIRSDLLDETNIAVEAAKDIKSRLAELFGTTVAIGNDFLKAGDEYDEKSLEILVGVTNYPQSKKWEKSAATVST